MTLSPSDRAPDFSLPADDGQTYALSDLAGKYVVLYFYPRDNTPGCTKQAIAFSALQDEFAALGAVVLGVSKDSLKKHANFRAKQDLTIPLLSDADDQVCEAYGVWVEKKMYGKTHLGIERSTFLIGPDGALIDIWRKVKVDGHDAIVLDALKAAQA